jgi:hypothetical protein
MTAITAIAPMVYPDLWNTPVINVARPWTTA